MERKDNEAAAESEGSQNHFCKLPSLLIPLDLIPYPLFVSCISFASRFLNGSGCKLNAMFFEMIFSQLCIIDSIHRLLVSISRHRYCKSNTHLLERNPHRWAIYFFIYLLDKSL